MVKRFNLLVLTILLVSQTILTPIASVNTIFAQPDNVNNEEEQINEQTISIEDEMEVDFSELEEVLIEVDALNDADYTKSSMELLDKVVVDAEEILEDEAITQEQVDEILKDLQKALEELEEASTEQEEASEEESPSENDEKDAREDKDVTEEKDASEEEDLEEEKASDEEDSPKKSLQTKNKEENVRPAAERDDDFFDLKISEIKDLQGNAYGEDNPLKPDDAFQVRMDWTLENGHDYQEGDTIKFQLPKELNVAADENELKDPDGNVVATYVITESGEVTLTFTKFVEDNSNVTGWIEIRAELDQDVVQEEDGKVVIGPIDDEGNQEIPIDRGPINKTVEKQGQPNKSYNADEIEWTVTINKNANALKDVTLEDLLPEGTEYVEGSLTAVKQAATLNGTPVGDKVEVAVTPSVTDGTLSIPLGDIEEVYTLTYTTKVTDMDEKTFKNNVTFKDADLEDTSADATVTINRGEPLKKGAVKRYDPKTGIIEWYLEFNYDQKSLDGVTLADNWKPAGKVELVDGSLKFQEVEIDENGQGKPIGNLIDPGELGNFEKVEDGFKVEGITTDKPYYVVYQTKVKDRELNGFLMENLASFGDNEYGEGYNIGQYVGEKSAGRVDYEKKTIEWTIRVNMDEKVMKDVEISDELGPGLTLIPDSVKVAIGGQEKTDFVLEEGNPFKITNIGDIETGVTVTYKTSYDADKVPNQNATNKADISWIPEGSDTREELEVNANQQLNEGTVNNSWKNATYDPDTKEIKWTIIANYRENSFEDFNISDTPQGNQKLMKDSIQVIEMKVNADGTHSDQGAAENADTSFDGNGFNVNLGKTNKAYKVVYKTSVAGLDDLAKEYENKAQVKDGNEVIADLDAKVGVYGDRKYGNKRGQQDGRRVNWSIDVNLAQEKISNLKLEDTISDNQAYIEDTIKVYNAKRNADGTITKTDLVNESDYTLEVNDNDFTISWNDDVERAFFVEYSTLFFAKDAEKVRNDYKITGDGISEEDTDASDGFNVTIKQTSGGGADGTAGYLLVHKVDTTHGQAEQPLDGIHFDLIDTSNDKVLKTVTTNEEGYADFGRLLFGTYKLREVNPPEGYVGFKEQEIEINKPFKVGESDPLDYKIEIENYKVNGGVELVKRDDDGNRLEGAEFTLFKADGTAVDTKTTNEDGEIFFEEQAPGNYYVQETKAPNGFELDETKHEVEITATQKEAIQLEVENKRIVTSVEIEKVWKDDEGETAKRPDSITINLLQNGEFYEEYEVTKADEWKRTITDLPAIDENGEEYEYTMTEQQVLGYAPSFDEDGNLTVTNTRTGERDITITKTWFDDNNKDEDRPSEITVLLEREVFEYIDGEGYVGTGEIEEVGEYTVTADEDWAYTVEKLPVFNENGLPYSYEFKEINVPEGYETESHDADITNTRVGKTEVKGEKFWKDDNDVENRPNSITVHLIQNGERIADQKVTPDEDGRWLYSFKELEKYDKNGVEYRYVVDEDSVFGYQSMPWSTTPGIINIDNKRVGNTGVEGQKIWEDNEDAEGLRPGSIKVQLLQNGKPYDDPQKVTEETDWKYDFENLPSYDQNGKAYEYTVEELSVEDYETSYDGNNIINRLVGETEVTVTKEWQGEPAGMVAVNLLANGDVVKSKTITAEDGWTHTFTELAKYDHEGKKIDYTVEEVELTGYTSKVTGDADEGFIITNTRSAKIDIPVTKGWLGAVGEKAKIHLLANGEKVENQSVDLTTDNDWKHTFEDLEEFDVEGQPIEYTVEEDSIDGFTPKYDGNAKDGFFVTNIRTGETSIDITKTWKDEDETDRPETIKVNLLANDTFVSEHEVTSENDWTLTIDDLPKYDELGEEIKYSISEQDVAGYESTVDGFDITNTRVEEKSITINKAWLDDDAEDRPAEIEVELFRSVEGGEQESVGTYQVKADDDWTLTIEDLPAFDADGKAYTYEIEEADVDGYASTVNGFDITNLREGTTSVDVTKVWKGEAATSATVYLLANGEEVEGQEITLTKDNDWKHTFTDLDEFDEDGKRITYTVKERSIEGYESTVTGNAAEGFTVTNLRVGTIAIAGTKTWLDDDAEEDRPKSITIQILQNGEEYDTVTVTPKSNWTYNVPNLPEYDENGEKYEYTVVEEEVEGYESSVDGYDLTNLRVGTTAIEGTKTWLDDGAENERPESITIQVLQNGKKHNTVTVTSKTDWTYEVLDLPKYDQNGVEYDYTVEENDVEGYESSVDGYDITNLRVDRTQVDITKTWKDNNDENRPESIKVNLLANGNQVSEHEITANNNWELTIKDLAKYDEQGKEIVYTISEQDVPGYKSTIEGFDITNTQKTYAIGDYVWVDRNKDGIQDDNEEPLEGVKVELFDENGDKIGETTTDEHGRYMFDELPAGKYKVKFTLTDEQAKKYKFTKQNTGDDVRNDSDADENGWTTDITLDDNNEQLTKEYDRDVKATEGIDPTWDAGVIELVNISVEKVWVDNDDAEEERPENITVHLLANEDEIETVKLSEKNNWTYHFNGLDKYDQSGNEISYTVTEGEVKGYKSDIEASEEGFVITNTKTTPIIPLEPITKVDVEKVWEGKALDQVTIHLLADGEKVDTVQLSEDNNWAHTFNSLPKYSDEDQEVLIEYTVEEDDVKGYEKSISGNAADGFTVTNKEITEEPETEDPADKEDPSDKEDEATDPSKPGKDDEDEDKPLFGGNLPNTATTIFSISLLGGILLLAGIALYVVRKRRTA